MMYNQLTNGANFTSLVEVVGELREICLIRCNLEEFSARAGI